MITLSILDVTILAACIVNALFGTTVRVSTSPADRRTLLIHVVAHLAESSSIMQASFHLSIHDCRLLHTLPDLRLYQILVDFVNIDLRKLLEDLHSSIRKYFFAGLNDYEDMLEELAHHLLDRVDNTNVEAIEGKLKHATVVDEHEG